MRKQEALLRLFAALLTSAIPAGDFYCMGAEISETPDTLPTLQVDAMRHSKEITSSTPLFKIDIDRLNNSGISDISEALRTLPGLNLKDYGGAGGLKTISVRGLGAKHSGVMYDGLPLSEIQNGEIDLSRYTLNNLSSLSLSTGGEADIFIPAMAAAYASSLGISTISAEFNKGMSLVTRLTGGSFGFINPYLHIAGSNGKNLNMTLTGDFIHSKNDYPFTLINGNEITHEHRQNSAMNSAHGEFAIAYKPSTRSLINGKIYYYNNHHHLPGPVIYYANPSNEILHNRNFFSQVNYRQGLGSKFTLRILGKFDWATTRYTDIDGQYPGGKLDQYYIQRNCYASGSLLFIPLETLYFSYAADYNRNELQSNLSSNTAPFRNAFLQTLGAKLKLNFIEVNARILHSLFRDSSKLNSSHKTYNRFSPSLSLSAKPFADTALFFRASYKNVLRMPTFCELYFDHYGTINLDPEISDQYNIGITYSTPAVSAIRIKSLQFTADGYINQVKNKIVAIPYNMFMWRMTNLGKVRMYGADFTLNSEISLSSNHSLEFGGSYSYLRAETLSSPDKADWKKQVAYTPLNSGSFTLSWLNPWVNVGTHGIGSSSRYATNENLPETKIKGYFEMGFSIFRSFSIKRSALSVRAELINAFNEQYEIIRRYPMPGRRVQLTLGYKFTTN